MPIRETRHTLEIGKGIPLHYRIVRGPSQRRPLLLLLHGMASNLTRWSEFVEQTSLKDHWDIMRVDLRGHGEPIYRGRLSMEIWSQDTVRLLDAEGYAEAVLIGHSLGAQLALHFASLCPNRTRGLALIDPILGRPTTPIVRAGRRYRHVLRALVIIVRALNRLGLYRRHIPNRDLKLLDLRTRETLLAEGKIEELVSEYSSPWPDLKHFPTANFIEEVIEMVRSVPPPTQIEVPVLVLLSKGGTYADPKTTREAIAQFPNAKTVIIDAEHWPLTEKPVEVREAIEQWCNELERP
ncbi:MAG: alpha/beta fold hydrolase [Acidiferrobacterales bacterium]